MPPEKGQRPLVPVVVRPVGINCPPGLPQGTGRKLLHCLPAEAAVGRVFQQMHQQTVVMQHRADAYNVGVAVARLAHRAEIPPLQLLPPLRRVHLLIVFNIVQHDQVGSSGAVPPSAQLLSRTHRVDPTTVLQQNHAAFPYFALLRAKIGNERFIFLQLGLDTVQKGGSLTFGIGYQQNILFIAVQGGVQHILQAHNGGFCVPAGSGQRQTAAGGCQHFFQCVGTGRLVFHHLSAPQRAQFFVKGRAGHGKVVAEIVPTEVHGLPCAVGLMIHPASPPSPEQDKGNGRKCPFDSKPG